jgi:hypothetical protein
MFFGVIPFLYSSCSIKFLSASVCCVVLLPLLTWLPAATNATVIRLAIAVGSNIKAILFVNTATVIAATAELPLLMWALSLPLPSSSCEGLCQNIYCCKYCICQHHCYHYHGRYHCRAAAIAACRRCHSGENRCKSLMLHIFSSFHFDNDNGDSDGKGDSNNNGNGDGDDLSLFVS